MDKNFLKNLLSAAALSALILIPYTYFTSKRAKEQEQAPQPPASASQTTDPITASEAAREPVGPATEPALAGDIDTASERAKAETIEFANGRYAATFSTLGGNLISLKLLDYASRVDPEERVELVMPEAAGTEDGPVPGVEGLACGLYINSGGIGRSVNNRNFTGTETANGVSFEATIAPGLVLRKSYAFNPEYFCFDVTVTFTNTSDVTMSIGADAGTSFGLEWGPGVETAESRLLGKVSPFQRMIFANGMFDDTAVGKFPQSQIDESVSWIALKSRYFLVALMAGDRPARAYTEAKKEDLKGGLEEEAMTVSLEDEPFLLPAGEEYSRTFKVYAGPNEKKLLGNVDPSLKQSVHFAAFLNPIGQLMLAIMEISYKIIPNYGISIIILTLLVKLVGFPLTKKSYKSMEKMQALQPDIKKLEEKYKNDKNTLNKKRMELFKERGVSPLGGCLPMLIQIPIFITLFSTLRWAFPLRGQPFILWMTDLSEPGILFYLKDGAYPVRVLPILMTGLMLLQQKVANPMGKAAAKDPNQKIMAYMPLIFVVFFYDMPAGLCLYMCVNVGGTLIHKIYTTMRSKKKEESEATA